MAEGLLRFQLKKINKHRNIKIRSAGTHVAWSGQPMDQRARRACEHAGFDPGHGGARQVRETDFMRYEQILAMDQMNYQWLIRKCPVSYRERITRLGSWAISSDLGDILDPYYGSAKGFEETLRQIEIAMTGVLEYVLARY